MNSHTFILTRPWGKRKIPALPADIQKDSFFFLCATQPPQKDSETAP